MLDTVMHAPRNHPGDRRPGSVAGAKAAGALMAAVMLTATGCADVFSGATASLGGNAAGERGAVRVVFINNTPHRAVFTAGTYDPLDEIAVPAYSQFGLDGEELTLPGDSESAVGGFRCARVFSIGGSRLLTLMQANDPDAAFVTEALQGGVTFFRDAETGTDPISEATISPFEADLGVDFPCGALLVIRFEINDVGDGPFRIDFEIVPSESPR